MKFERRFERPSWRCWEALQVLETLNAGFVDEAPRHWEVWEALRRRRLGDPGDPVISTA